METLGRYRRQGKQLATLHYKAGRWPRTSVLIDKALPQRTNRLWGLLLSLPLSQAHTIRLVKR